MKAEYCRIAEALFGHIEWESPVLGYLTCPGAASHTSPTGVRHCRITLDQVPTLYCFHSSCEDDLRAANHRLRAECGRYDRGQANPIHPAGPRVLTPAEIAAAERKAENERIKRHSQESLALILEKHAIDQADLWESSPCRLLDNPERDWRLLLSLFQPDDVVWIGGKFSSCGEDKPESEKARCRRFFRPVRDWLAEPAAPNQFTCPSTFQPGTYSRCNEQVLTRRFLVIESDTLTKEQMCAVINWCRSFMRLRAIVDTAGKSLHGWFDVPSDDMVEELRVILPNLGRTSKTPTLDPALFKLAQPCRLPGALRDGRQQCLLYLDPTP